jgi:N-acetylmuramoyl-L-alanine amidase
MPALLIETGFINSEIDNKLYDEKQKEIAQSIADAILGTLNEEDVEGPPYYRVQVGAFKIRENADRLLYELLDKGYPAFIIEEDGLYKVQVGAYLQIGNAINMEQRLRDEGYSTLIVMK